MEIGNAGDAVTLEDDIRSLTGVGLFAQLNKEQLRLMAFGAERIRVLQGRDLYRQHARADCAYVVADGKIELYSDDNGERRVLQTVGPGAMLGEFALICETERLTGAMAAEDSSVIRLNRSLFRRVLEEYPDIASRLHKEIAARLGDMVDKLTKLESRFIN